MHTIMWLMSDRAIPRSFRFMEGFGVHTFRFVNAQGRSTFVKFHWKPKLGVQSVVWDEAVKINGARTPTSTAATCGTPSRTATFPSGSWACSSSTTRSPTASTSTCSTHQAHPRGAGAGARVGRLVLDRMVDNFFAETEQVAFCTQNVVPGIDFTNDPLLQGATSPTSTPS
jgi:catalase